MRRAFAQAVALSLCLAIPSTAQTPPSPAPAPDAGHRTEDQTYLTFPEWFLVFSPAEYATYVKTEPPSDFPFWGHVRQFWQAYGAVHEATKAFPFNGEYHTMIMVIGVSTTVEYGLRLAYETLVGRLTEITTTYPETEEDRLAAEVAQDYVDFIRVRPWYEYDFTARLRQVWGTSLFGGDMLRKWERKYALTTEYAVKAAYGWLIGRGTQASFGAEVPTTAVRLRGLTPEAEAALPELKIATRGADGVATGTAPRYQAFTDHAMALARAGVTFEEIAGNRGGILVSAIVPVGWEAATPGARILFTQPILTRPAEKRVALVVPVASLSALLLQLGPPAVVEHVFDY